ncbi:hypothetical protein EP7_000877 [Isosphaeraceae bacterium EP7]
MKRTMRGLLAGPWLGAILSLLTAGIVSPNEAVAGCAAHYLNAHPQLRVELAGLESQLLGGTTSTERDRAPRPQPPACDGALCSGNPSTPTTAVPSLPPLGAEQWALSVDRPATADPDAGDPFDVVTTLRSLNRPAPIFHPPRLATSPITS